LTLMVLFCIISHLRASLSDPGYISKQQQVQNQQLLLEFEESNKVSNDTSNTSLKDHEMNICPRCQVQRPLDSHHCRICHKCIRNRHHHCQWINNCIGEFNQKYFILFVFYISKYFLYICLSNKKGFFYFILNFN
jgi:hypothetical protein